MKYRVDLVHPIGRTNGEGRVYLDEQIEEAQFYVTERDEREFIDEYNSRAFETRAVYKGAVLMDL